jgi:uncharacterized protein (TIGR03437 family)
MLTMFRLAPVRFTPFAMLMCFLALGRFDTAQAQTLTVSNSSLAFTAAQGSNPNPNFQYVNVGSTGGNANYNITFNPSGSWLSAAAQNGSPGGSASGTAPDQIAVAINSTSLASGTYPGTVTLTPSGGGTAVTISISLTVSGSGTTTSTLSASPSQLTFGYELHQLAPPTQTTQIVSSGIPLPITFGINQGNTGFGLCPTGWLGATLSSATTPATLTVNIGTAGLGAGTCSGSITVGSTTATNGTTTTSIGVTLFVSSSALLNIGIPAGLQTITLQQGGRPIQFGPNTGNPLELTSSDPNQQLNFTLSTSSTNNWLSLSPSSGTTPAAIDVQITPGTVLSPGPYTGSITITSQGLLNNTTTIPISLTITSSSSVTISPTGGQNFTEAQGGALPQPITLTLTGAAAQSPSFTTSVIQQSGGLWLQVSPQSGSLTSTPTSSSASVTLSVLPNTLTQGTYSSEAVITFQNSAVPQIIIAVSLTVQPPASALVATPSAVSFSYQAGTAVPAPQTVAVTNPASGSIPYTIASVSDSWLSVAPASGNTPGTVSVSVSPQSLQPGSYNGSFTLTSPGVGTTTVSVALFISASTTPQPFIISNAASGVGSALSPGEIITIKGSGLGPGNPVSFTVNSLSNPILAGVQVTFSGFSGTLLYVSSTQINVIVPYEIAGSSSATIVVAYQSVQSTPITQPVAAASLGLFTDNASGTGQAAVLNQNFTYNTVATPATQGSYISVYATGGGQTSPASTDGEVTPSLPLSPLVLQQYVTATIGGKPATVVFAGAAPGDVTGVVQFNIQVPTGVSGGALPIVVTISGPVSTQSQANATVAVQ